MQRSNRLLASRGPAALRSARSRFPFRFLQPFHLEVALKPLDQPVRHPWSCLALLIAAMGGHGCEHQGVNAAPVIALVTGESPVTQMAIEDVRRETAGRAPVIEVVVDLENPPGGERADDEVGRAERLVQLPGLIGVVGHLGSRGSLAAAPVYNEAQVVQLVPTATTHLLGTVGPWTFTLAPNDSIEGATLGRFAAEQLGAKKVALFYVPDEYGMGLRVRVMRELRRHEVRVVDNVPVSGTADLETLLTSSLQREPPDLIFCLCPAGQTGNLARLAQAHRRGMRILAGDAASSLDQLIPTAGAAVESIYVATFWIPPGRSEVSRMFTTRFQALTDRLPSAGEALTYDAVMLLASAARAMGPRRDLVRQYLEELGDSRPPYDGVTGEIAFGEDNRPRQILMARVRGRVLESVPWR